MRRLGTIAAELRAGGLLGSTPIAIVANATLPQQSIQVGDLDSVDALAAAVEGLPALVIVGEEDVATAPAKAERIVAGIANAKLVVIPKAGHSSTLEQPTAVNAAIKEFLEGLGSAA